MDAKGNYIRDITPEDLMDAAPVTAQTYWYGSNRNRKNGEFSSIMRMHLIAAMRGEGCTYEEIGAHLGITRERVRQIQTKYVRLTR
jgi:hypothetical protein